jgi:RND family efflux transporter MFP subunit
MEALDFAAKHRWKIAGLAAVMAALAFQWKHVGSAIAGQARPAAVEIPIGRTSGSTIHADGRVVCYPGAVVVVGTDVGGTLKALPVLEKATVKKGELLAEIDASEQKAALAEARALIAEADVDSRFYGVELDRSQRLLASSVVTRDSVDRSARDRDAAKAHRESAAATAGRLATVVNKTRIVSPIDGVVMERFVESGETVAAGARLVRVADLMRTRVEAEVDEYDTARIAVGLPVSIRAEGFDGVSWRGTIEEIPDEVRSRRLKPQDPAHPSDTRVLLVKVALAETLPVKLGQRVEVEIAIADRR